MKSTYNQSLIISDTTTTNSTDTIARIIDKFTLRTFNRLAYDREINGLLVASLLLRLPEYYTISYNIKLINIRLLNGHFYELTFDRYNQIRDENNFIII